jgi:lysylphosphatidylglycerol synthetase-like protein (DUF2156 family)
LLGRDRARIYPWFTVSITLTALRLLSQRMLAGRMPQITMAAIFITLAVVSALVSLLVVVELARRTFSSASRRAWIIATLVLLAVGVAVLATLGPWPAWKSLAADSALSTLRLMQLVAQKADLLASVLIVELGILVVLAGRYFKAGFRSHTQQIVIGLSTASIAQMAVRGIWQAIALHAAPQSQAEYDRVLGLQEKLYNANSAVFLAAVVFWIVCLWINEPGTGSSSTLPVAVAAETSQTVPDAVSADEEK